MSRVLALVAVTLLTPTTVASLQNVWPSQSYVTESFQPPNVTVIQTGATAPGYLFISPVGNGTTSPSPLIFTNHNELIWNGPAGGWAYTDFQVQRYDGKPHLTYWRGNASATFGHGYGNVHLLNSSYDEVYTVCPKGLGIVTPGNVSYACYLDQHEALVTPQGTLLATAYNVTRADMTAVGGPSDGWIFDSIFYEIEIATGKVLFRWRSLDYPERIPITESKYPLHLGPVTYGSTGADPWDYFHINSVQKLSDGYLVNSRHLFSTYKVSFNGSIDWHLSGYDGGDFALGPDVYFSWQHRPRIVSPRDDDEDTVPIVYFNNDNSEAQNGTNSTTGLQVNVHLHNRTATLAKKLLVADEPIFAASQGSYQPLPGNHALIGYGQIAKTREFDADNRLIYEATYGYSNATSLTASYRSYREEWHAQPAASPKAAVRDGKLYVSWNGATEVESWKLYSGESCSHLATASRAEKKTGFESAYSLGDAHTGYVLAEALDGHGKALAKSNCVSVT